MRPGFRSASCLIGVVLLLLVSLVNCKTPGPGAVSGLRDDEDPPAGGADPISEEIRREITREALTGLVGSDLDSTTDNSCINCHDDFNGAQIHQWGQDMHGFINTCNLKNIFDPGTELTEATAQTFATCIKENVSESGLFRTGVKHTRIKEVFDVAGMSDDYTRVKRRSMPPGSTTGLDDQQFYSLFAWIGIYSEFNETALGDIRAVLVNEGGSGGPPLPLTQCEDKLTPEMASHIETMKRRGWSAKNKADPNFQSFGCKPGVEDPKLCFSGRFFRGVGGVARFPQKEEFAAKRPATNYVRNAKIRLLKDIGQSYTSYWMRTSADGRFIGVGGRGFERLDAETTRDTVGQVTINASYDPGFFPNNSGFVFQGGGLLVCNQKILDDSQILQAETIRVGDGGFFDDDDFGNDEDNDNEDDNNTNDDDNNNGNNPIRPEDKYCSVSGSVSLYQSVGTSLTGEDYFYLAGGNWVGDAGGAYSELPVGSFASDNSSMRLHLARSNGEDQAWADNNDFSITTPYQGDWFLSPSGTVMIGREATKPTEQQSESVHNGYVIRSLNVTYSGEGAERRIADVQTQEIAKICLNGRKPVMSLDERFLATHHYVKNFDFKEYGFESENDEEFTKRIDNSADIWLVDLKTGKKSRVTNMGPGRKALFPHFRSDGWIYFLVMDNTSGEGQTNYYMASDAAILMAR